MPLVRRARTVARDAPGGRPGRAPFLTTLAISGATLEAPTPMASNLRSSLSLIALCLCLGAACTSSSQFGIVLRPGTTASLQVLGDNPFVAVDNDGPGSIDISFTPEVGTPDRVRVLRGSSARCLRGGGKLEFALVEGDQATLQVNVQHSTGTDLRTLGKNP